jgi:hypothetical protein
MKKVAFFMTGVVFSVVIACGLFMLAEFGYRALGFNANRGSLIDVNLIPYSPYVISTQPPNTVLGFGNSILDGYFGKDECTAADGATARFNSLGFRGGEFPVPSSKKSNEIRVLITGGSASVSWNIGELCTLDVRMKERLQKLLPDNQITVINLGSGTWKSFQELIAIQLYGVDLDPDLVVHFSGFNDSFHPYYMGITQAYAHGLMVVAFDRYRTWVYGTPRQFLSEFRITDAVKALLAPLPAVLSAPANAANATHAHPEIAVKPMPGGLATVMRLPLDLDSIERRTDFDPYSRSVVDNYLKNSQLMARTIAVKRAVLLSVLQPTLYLKTPLAEAERRKLDGYAPTVNFTVQNYLRLRKGLTDLAGMEPNLKFLDMSDVFNGKSGEFFGDNVHFYKGGYAIVGEQIADAVVEALKGRSKAALPRTSSGG